MMKPLLSLRYLILFFFLASYIFENVSAQAIVRVRVVSVQVLNNVDCDGFFTGNSDFVWEFTATDNTIGYTNNNPALFGIYDFNYAYNNGQNGPFTLNSPGATFSPNSGVFFDHQYICPTDVPSSISLEWEAYENDDAGNYDIVGLTDGETGLQTVPMPVPAAPGSLFYTFNASSTDGGCPQNYRINLEVQRVGFATTTILLADDICNATPVNLNVTYNMAFCLSNDLENNEPRAGNVAATNSSAWFKFVAPPSGSVEISTDFAGTEFGTYFEIYHAADGGNCGNGVQPITGVLLKDKFDYLSHIEFSDGLDIIDPEAQISLDACDPIPLISYQKLIAGQTYYVQLAADDANDAGIVQVRVSDLGGGAGADPSDIPCLSSTCNPLTNQISSQGGNPATVTIGFGCSYDGGNDYGETGGAHTNTDPNNYHAYDYDHVAANNTVMNESVWFNFVAPNQGRMIFEADYQSALYGENNALFGYDKRFAPGTPADFSCANLEFIAEDDGGANNFLGGDPSAVISVQCLEPGYKYYGMIDPSDNVTPLNSQQISAWLYDPSVVNPTPNPPGNDILCLAMADPLFEIPVTPAGTNPNFQAVAGTNEFACREYLAGEPPAATAIGDRADQTVWHYFVAPPSGSVEMNIRAYIGMDTLRYNIYQLLNGTDCYGGLNPATFTTDGTQSTPIITPWLQGSAGFEGTQESLCCLVPGTIYAIQLDGGSPGDEGQYIIEYIREVASDAGDIFVDINGNIINVNQPDTAFVCFGDTINPGIMLNGIGQSTLDIPSCLQLGYVIHSTNPIPNPVANSGFTFIDSVQTQNGIFVNNTNGSGSFGNPQFNQLYWLSPMADEPANWGDLTCNSSTVGAGLPLVYLQPVVPVSNFNASTCEITFSSSGGLSSYYGTNFTYTILNASSTVVSSGSFAAGTNVVYAIPSAGIFTITISDGACPYSFTVDASTCSNPCILAPIINNVNATICSGQTIFLQGANQTSAGIYTDVFTAVNGCDSTVNTTLSILQPSSFTQNLIICEGNTVDVGTNSYNTSGQYIDVLVAANGCDSTVTTNLFVTPTLISSQQATICAGDTYPFGGNNLTLSGTYTNLLSSVSGCDSVVTLFLTVLPELNSSMNVVICAGQSYTFGSQTLNSSGTYTQTIPSVAGCDSTITLFLNVEQPIDYTTSVTICEGQTYSFNNQIISSSGTYTGQFQTVNGCDSVVTLYLFVDDAASFNIDSTICEGESMVFGSQTLTQSGLYTEVFTSVQGCDSIVNLELSVLTDCDGDFLISNMVTPNDDGQNDTWKISDYTRISGCAVVIYNRWGQPVYETNDYQNEWAGTKNGELLPDGVYFYSIKCSEDEFTGPINLLRLKK